MTEHVANPIALHMARITIEARTPLSIGGGEDSLFDVSLARDANGLPCIPGSSLQGALRNLWVDVHGDEHIDLLGTGKAGFEQSGRVTFGWGCVHDAKGVAVTGLLADAPDFSDSLLAELAEDAPLHRHHAPLGPKHTVEGPTKHERVAVPMGTRFSVEFTMLGSGNKPDISNDAEKLEKLLALVEHTSFRLGGASGRGYGAIRIVAASYRCFDLNSGASFASLRSEREKPPSTLLEVDIMDRLRQESSKGIVTARLLLEPKGLWRVGQSRNSQTARHRVPSAVNGRPGADSRNKPVDVAPVREPFIQWVESASKTLGKWCEPGADDFIVGGSGIRGILAHRALYHWNRLTGKFIDADHLDGSKGESARKILSEKARPKALAGLFGNASQDGLGESRAGRILVDDALVHASNLQAIDHNSIDRFTGGVRNRLLFSEEAAMGGRIGLSLVIKRPHRADNLDYWPDEIVNALLAALDDLCSERVAIGAKSMGYVAGQISWEGDTELVDRWKGRWAAIHSPRASEVPA